MNLPVALLIFSLALTILAPAGEKETNKFVSYGVSIGPGKVKPGAQGALLFTLTPVKGIHINMVPPVQFLLEPNKSVTLKGTPEMTKAKKSSYLDPKSPIKQKFTIAPSTTPGTIRVKGTLVYFYCSDGEGWCSKFKQPVELSLPVAK